MFIKEKNYKRAHLRAPYKTEILFADAGFVHKARALNISEGGCLLDHVPYFPENESVPLMMMIPNLPMLKNFDLEKLKDFSFDLFPSKIIRAKGKMVRGIRSEDNEALKVGLSFTEIDQLSKKIIQDYVSSFASNLVYMQVLLDSLHADEKYLEKLRLLSKILGYDPEIKVALLRKELLLDYQSLQWL